VVAEVPEAPEGGAQPQRETGGPVARDRRSVAPTAGRIRSARVAGIVRPVDGPAQRRAQVAVLALQAVEPRQLPRPLELGLGPLRERDAVRGVRPADGLGLAGGLEALQPELADRLQHLEAGAAAGVGAGDEQAGRHQRGEPVGEADRVGADGTDPADGHGGGPLRRAPAGEDGEAAEQRSVSKPQQLVAPGDRRSHRPLAVRGVARPAGEQGQAAPRQLRVERGRRHGAQTHRGQLEGQGEPVQAPADRGHGGGVRIGQGEVRPHRPGTPDEQVDGLTTNRPRPSRPDRGTAARGGPGRGRGPARRRRPGQRQGRDGELLLPGQA
jgi:hypothetical protein